MTASGAGRPDVRVGVVSWNTAALLDRCLAALAASLAGLDAEVVVVDNASADDSAAVARRHDGVTVVANPDNRGYARGMNQALDGSAAPVLIALNPDTEPPPGSLAALVATVHAHPEAGVVVPRLTHADGTLQHSVYRFPSVALAAAVCFVPPRWQRGEVGRRWWLEGAAPHDRSGPVDWAIGAVHAMSAEAIDGRPPYSERWFMYVEDLELCWRLARQGRTTWLDADVTIPHVGNAAGAQAWGGGRERRWWEASYDFYGQARGRGAARRWALVNTTGVLLHLALLSLGALVPGPRRSQRRHAAGALRSVLGVHARAVLHGPPPPRTDPPGASSNHR